MILQAQKGTFSIDLSQVESIEKLTDLSVQLVMRSGKTHKVDFSYETIVRLWSKHHDEEIAILKNLDENTFRPRM